MNCSTTENEPLPPLPEVPTYLHAPHPDGIDLTDVRALFSAPSAPTPESLKNCDQDFRTLEKKVQTKHELNEGAREFVQRQPIEYHWCFYHKLLETEDFVVHNGSWTQREKKVLETYAFLVPLAHGFQKEYHDPRYLRWASQHYQRLSNWVFYRRLNLTPQARSEIFSGSVENPFALWQKPEEMPGGVLEKYGIVETKPIPAATPPVPVAPVEPAAPKSSAPAEPVAAQPPEFPDELAPEPNIRMESDRQPADDGTLSAPSEGTITGPSPASTSDPMSALDPLLDAEPTALESAAAPPAPASPPPADGTGTEFMFDGDQLSTAQ